MKKFKAIISAFALALCASVTAVGFGGWIIQGSGNAQYDKYYDPNAKKVAYTQDPKGVNTYFTTVEKALEKTSSGTVYVIPGANPTINTNCKVKSGVSLYLPYEDDLKNVHSVEDSGRTSTGDFADRQDAVNDKGFCKSMLTLADNVTLTNEGTIFVGGVLGRQGMDPTGMTVGNYSKINLGKNSKIANTGEITCYGYIKETEEGKDTANVENTGNGKLNLPIVIYDFRGGSYSAYAVGTQLGTQKATMPFNVFDFPNIQCDVSFTGNSTMDGTVTIYASDKVNMARATLIGPENSSSLIRIVSGTLSYRCNAPLGYLYDDFNKNTKENAVNRTTFTINGKISIASMTLDAGVSIDTKKYHLPFSYKFAFNLNSGSIDISNKVKFLAGAKVYIGKNAEILAKNETVFYQNYIPPITTGKNNAECYPYYAKSAELINNGKLTISSSFGGIISSASENAKTITASGFSDSITTTETLTGEKLGVVGSKETHTEHAKVTRIDKRVFDPNSDTAMLGVYGRTSDTFDTDSVEGGKTYTSHRLADFADYVKFGWYAGGPDKYGVRYVLNSNTATNPNSIMSFDTDKGTSLIHPLTNANANLEFAGYYYASDFKMSSMLKKDSTGNYILDPAEAVIYLGANNYISLYGKWIDVSKKVTIQFRKYDDNGALINSSAYYGVAGEVIALSNYDDYKATERNPEINPEISKITYQFKNWAVKDNTGNTIELSGGSFTPSTANAVYYVDPAYTETNYVYVQVNNKKYNYGINYNVIKSASVSGTQSVNLLKGGAYVCLEDTIKVTINDVGIGTNPHAVITINESQITIAKGKTYELDKNNSQYVNAVNNCNGPIVVDAVSK